MDKILSFKERGQLLFEASNKYRKCGYKLVSQKNYSLRMKAMPIFSKKMKFKKKVALVKFLLFKRNLKLGSRKEFVAIDIDMYGNIHITEED